MQNAHVGPLWCPSECVGPGLSTRPLGSPGTDPRTQSPYYPQSRTSSHSPVDGVSVESAPPLCVGRGPGRLKGRGMESSSPPDTPVLWVSRPGGLSWSGLGVHKSRVTCGHLPPRGDRTSGGREDEGIGVGSRNSEETVGGTGCLRCGDHECRHTQLKRKSLTLNPEVPPAPVTDPPAPDGLFRSGRPSCPPEPLCDLRDQPP